MEPAEVKIHAFEYVLSKLVAWYKDVYNSTEESNDISTIKALKLLFFISAVNADKDSEDTLLDCIFDNFVAMPYGHVESDVYSSMKSKEHLNISIDNNSSFILESYNSDTLDAINKIKIDSSISKLRGINNNLIKMSPFDLVELSHSWYSWKFYFEKAKRKGSNSEIIPSEIIKSEQKFFYL